MANKKQSAITYQQVENSTVSFKEFYAVYASMEGFDHVPDFHWRMVEFLEDCDNWINNVGVLQAFRGASKSSLTAAFVAWRLARDASLLFLIQSADDGLSMKMSSDVSKIVTNHPYCKHLLGSKNKWTERGFRVNGATSGRNLSVTARGIFSNVTGFRAHFIIYDDCEVLNTARSESLREDLRTRISESARLLHPNGKRLFVGTPHATDSIYPEMIDRGASSFRIPFLENIEGEWPYCNGTSSWPERWPLDLILQVQQTCRGKAEWFSQYLLIPMLAEESTLDIALAKQYKFEPEFIEANDHKLYRINGETILGHCAFWDPALSKVGRDASVLAIVFVTIPGNIYVHRTVAVSGEVDDQCKQVRKLLIEFCVPTCYIETNGIGSFIPQLLLKHTTGLGIAIDGKHTSMRKSESIQTAFETPLSAGILHVHDSVMQSKFLGQLRDFNPRSMRGADDFIDAPAKAIHLLPIHPDRASQGRDGFTPYRMHSESIDIAVDYA